MVNTEIDARRASQEANRDLACPFIEESPAITALGGA
jgi:hypothetical protein